MMDNTIAISVKNITKVYDIVLNQERLGTRTLQEDIIGLFRKTGEKRSKHKIHALNDVSFDVREGEVLGLVGANGAGKSTMLKILSRITKPTSGTADLYGRVGSLLEVGTGFHTELTGRENIYLSGTILGMRKKEIDSKFDEILEFSGIGRYIDTPVKRYSSGMQTRLGFAVASHLEPEILLIDEVLAVGDAAFQKKCLGKMSEIAQAGRTIIFVSHNMDAVIGLCTRALWINHGKIEADGEPAKVVEQYLAADIAQGKLDNLADRPNRPGNGLVRLTGFHVEGLDGRQLVAPMASEGVNFVLGYEKKEGEEISNVGIWVWLRDGLGRGLTTFSTTLTGENFADLPQKGEILCSIKNFPLREGTYYLDLGVDVNGIKADRVIQAVKLDVIPGDFYGTGKSLPQYGGDFFTAHSWRIRD